MNPLRWYIYSKSNEIVLVCNVIYGAIFQHFQRLKIDIWTHLSAYLRLYFNALCMWVYDIDSLEMKRRNILEQTNDFNAYNERLWTHWRTIQFLVDLNFLKFVWWSTHDDEFKWLEMWLASKHRSDNIRRIDTILLLSKL